MLTTLIAIGNSTGIRIPKPLLIESGIEKEVELIVKKGEIKIVKAKKSSKQVKDTLLLSEKILANDWDREEEDEAWKNLK